MTQAKWIIQQGYREGNLITVGTQPTAAEQTEGLYRLNRLVDGIFGYELGENLEDWLFPSPQRTAPVAARYPQGPFITDTTLLGSQSSSCIYPYPPTNRRIVFGAVTGTLYFPEKPEDGSRMALVQGSGLGDEGVQGAATGVLTFTAQPAANDTVTVGTQIYTFVTALTAINQVLIGASIPATLANLSAAINAGAGNGTVYYNGTIANGSATAAPNINAPWALTATAILSGTAGNSIATTKSTAAGSWAATTLLGGVVGSIITLDGNGRLINGAPTQQLYTPVAPTEWFYRADLGSWLPRFDMSLTDEMIFPSDLDDFFICALAKRLAGPYGKVTSNETIEMAQRTLKRLQARYRQTQVTTYGSENIPRTDQTYLGGSWWW